MSGDDDGLTLVMPFVTVASNGGPHDDVAYTAGWQMGGISVLLCMGQPQAYDVSIRTDCVEQADLIAMDRGYTLKVVDSEVEGWSFASFMRMAALDGER